MSPSSPSGADQSKGVAESSAFMSDSPITRSLADRLRTRILAKGPLSFEEWLEACLYDSEGGFYTTGGSAGRRGHFLTSPEVGPLFGTVLSVWLDNLWESLGRPTGFTVVEAAAGAGTLARSVAAADPSCLVDGRYVMVERSEFLRNLQPTGNIFSSVTDLTEVGLTEAGVVLANELLDNLAFGLLESDGLSWRQVMVGLQDNDSSTVDPAFREIIGDIVEPPVHVMASEMGVGSRIPVQTHAASWVASAIQTVGSGAVLVFDYVSSTASMASRPIDEWRRTYREHRPGGPAVETPGSQDVTAEVAIDQLPSGVEILSQADFLGKNGIDDLVSEGRRLWAQRAHLGDLEVLKARSRITEAEALMEPTGLGGFTVLEWRVPG